VPAASAARPPRPPARRRVSALFLLCVALPTVLAALYYGLVASDVYLSESRFVVRTPQRAQVTGLGNLLTGTGIARAQDDAYPVHDYMLSRDALRELDKALNLRQAYGAAEVDRLHRFPGLDGDDSFEALYRHHLDYVGVAHDSVSGITTLVVRGFQAERVQQVNERLLQLSEALVNRLNERSRQDLVRFAEQEVQLAQNRARDAGLALSSYRSQGAVFDPTRESAAQLESVAKLREELRLAEAQRAQIRQLSPANPQLPALDQRVRRLQQQVEQEQRRVLGKEGSLAAKAPAYDRLLLDKGFADAQLASALAALEAARTEAARQRLYLERLVQPNLPDQALEPRRLRSVVTVFVLGLVVWGVLALVVASIREHAD
jgi:capsular polysaccharide transport system permease protein